MTSGSAKTSLTIAVVYPDLLGTYGDGGNGLILARRASWRGVDTQLLEADSDAPLPDADLYCIGGGEDGPQVRAAETLLADGTLHGAVAAGAVVLGVCAGFQLLGHSFPDSADRPHPGLGLLDVTTRKGTGARAVGELVADADRRRPTAGRWTAAAPAHRVREPRGSHHGGRRGEALARVERGVGNGGGDGSEGAWSGRVLGSYLHGPLLARNTALADLLLGWALAPSAGATEPVDLTALDDTAELALRHERLTTVEHAHRPGRWSRLRIGLR